MRPRLQGWVKERDPRVCHFNLSPVGLILLPTLRSAICADAVARGSHFSTHTTKYCRFLGIVDEGLEVRVGVEAGEVGVGGDRAPAMVILFYGLGQVG